MIEYKEKGGEFTMSRELDVKIINPSTSEYDDYYLTTEYEDFIMYLPYPDLRKANILEGIKYVILYVDDNYVDDDSSGKWFICNIVDSCIINDPEDSDYDEEYNHLNGEYTGEFSAYDDNLIGYYIGIGVDILFEIKVNEKDIQALID